MLIFTLKARCRKHHARTGSAGRNILWRRSGGAVEHCGWQKLTPGAVVAIICDRGDRYLSTGVFGEEHFSQADLRLLRSR
ncbi:hypothetical protein OHD60_20300 [Escherichia coli]|nr:hypothetical protein [Escherichia coli]